MVETSVQHLEGDTLLILGLVASFLSQQIRHTHTHTHTERERERERERIRYCLSQSLSVGFSDSPPHKYHNSSEILANVAKKVQVLRGVSAHTLSLIHI